MATLKNLISNLAVKHPELTYEDHKIIAEIVFAEIASNLQQQNRIEIRGFGTFSIRHRLARIARDPRFCHDEKYNVDIPAKNNIYFRLGKAAHDIINDK